MGVVFSTYHSIDVAKNAIDGEFDLVLCDEAHRTTGAEDKGSASYFTKVHDDGSVKAKKRLYMTATPRVYGEAVKNRVEVYSMDDEDTYGKEMHNYSFDAAVDDKQLSDFKVRIPVIPGEDLATYTNESIDGEDGTVDERVLLAAVWHGFNYNGEEKRPLLQRVISFSNKIRASKQFAGVYGGDARTQDEDRYEKRILENEDDDRVREDRSFGNTVKKYEAVSNHKTGNTVSVRHMDGTMRASIRNNKMRWLKDSDQDQGECRILSNARCLSEGVDVPALDAVIFLQPRKSKTDVIQSVGRVMRKSPGKEYGYVILPVVIPTGMTFEQSLHDNRAWKTVWQVLSALRSHNPNFANEINRVNLDRSPGGGPAKLENVEIVWMGSHHRMEPEHEMFGRLVTRMVEKVGDRTYFEDRARQLGEKASEIRDRIKTTYETGGHPSVAGAVDSLCMGLRSIINHTINEAGTINVLAQHHALSQVFDTLFPEEFRSANPVAAALDDSIGKIGMRGELEDFEGFYGEVRREAGKFQSRGGKQEYIRKIYGNFLLGFDKKKQESEGVVYTPGEVIDFIIHSVEHVLREEFGTGFNDRRVKVFDPFTGTGSFVTGLLESGLITRENLPRKYSNDMWANEINLLAYYVASVNIESVFEKVSGKGMHVPFRNINYTDTLNHNPRYRLDERHRYRKGKLHGRVEKIVENIKRHNYSHIHVIFGNPPYSAGQSDFNDQNQNVEYPVIDDRIKKTYLEKLNNSNQKIGNVNSIYDSYIRSIHWASDRIGNSGVIGFVTNAGFLRADAAAGMRACLREEFSGVWVFDLRGNQRTQGEISKKEGGKIFGSGSRTPVAITILVKNPDRMKKDKKGRPRGTIRYKDIGDYHSREEKIRIISDAKSVQGITGWKTIRPDKHHDWLDQRGGGFAKYLPMGSKEAKAGRGDAVFGVYFSGVKTQRDAWAYNSSEPELSRNMKKHIDYCNQQDWDDPEIDPKKAKWDEELSKKLKKAGRQKFEKSKIRRSLYRPFFRQFLYFDKMFNVRQYLIPKFFPRNDSENMVICVPHKGRSGMFSTLVTDVTPDLHVIEQSQCFPLYTYDGGEKRYNITDHALHSYRKHYGDDSIKKIDIFHYVYGLLHHPGYRKKFASNLSRELPHIPMAPDFRAFSRTGRELADLHLSWETCERHNLGTPKHNPKKFSKLSFGRTTVEKDGKKNHHADPLVLLADGDIVFDNLPDVKYTVNGRAPVARAVDRYELLKDKGSGITNDATGVDLVPLIERLVHVGVESDRLISGLPEEFEPEGWEPRKVGLDAHMGVAQVLSSVIPTPCCTIRSSGTKSTPMKTGTGRVARQPPSHTLLCLCVGPLAMTKSKTMLTVLLAVSLAAVGGGSSHAVSDDSPPPVSKQGQIGSPTPETSSITSSTYVPPDVVSYEKAIHVDRWGTANTVEMPTVCWYDVNDTCPDLWIGSLFYDMGDLLYFYMNQDWNASVANSGGFEIFDSETGNSIYRNSYLSGASHEVYVRLSGELFEPKCYDIAVWYGPVTEIQKRFCIAVEPDSPPAPTVGVSGKVYTDANGNGKLDPGETGLSDMTVVAYSYADLDTRKATTDANGDYSFGLPPGGYMVQVEGTNAIAYGTIIDGTISEQNLGL